MELKRPSIIDYWISILLYPNQKTLTNKDNDTSLTCIFLMEWLSNSNKNQLFKSCYCDHFS